MEFIIGLVDDDDGQLATIRRTIKINAPKDIKCDFKSYDLAGASDSLVSTVYKEIIDDVESGCLSLLIIDYKIMIKADKVEGTDIYEKIRRAVPQFPVIMLTNVIDDCINHSFVDPDKVYRKSDFFRTDEGYSKEKTANIFRNMQRYVTARIDLESRLSNLKDRLVDENQSQELYNELIRTENELDEYKPLDETQMEKAFDTSAIKEAIELLEKADAMLEDK
ncbi:MAG: hypothetical protein FWC73_07590 [Defluviitaleaceae bacterium]|nr:hypothetical protein [Defluviitaleaceae bacterium]